MTLKEIESLLEQRIGLSPEAIGSESIAKSISKRMTSCNLTDVGAYYKLLLSSHSEWDELVESVVVPETWFFRNKASFAFLERYVRYEWLVENKDKILRVLSIPCASGEEAYSIAITLLDAGMMSDQFRIDALDISKVSIQKAIKGVYGRESFRGQELSFRDRYFVTVSNGYRIRSVLRNLIQFAQGNLLDETLLAGEPPYDIIFCRNVLIYLSTPARKRVIDVIQRLLSQKGILFVGHVERPLINGSGFVWVRQPGVFACRRASAVPQVEEKHILSRPSDTRMKSLVTTVRSAVSLTDSMNKASTCLPKSTVTSKPPNRLEEYISQENDIEKLLESAHLFANKGQLAEAIKLCEKCLSLNALDIQANFLMGVINHALDQEKKAEEFFIKTIYLDPNHYEALMHLAFITEHKGDHHRAEQLRKRIQRILMRGNKG